MLLVLPVCTDCSARRYVGLDPLDPFDHSHPDVGDGAVRGRPYCTAAVPHDSRGAQHSSSSAACTTLLRGRACARAHARMLAQPGGWRLWPVTDCRVRLVTAMLPPPHTHTLPNTNTNTHPPNPPTRRARSPHHLPRARPPPRPLPPALWPPHRPYGNNNLLPLGQPPPPRPPDAAAADRGRPAGAGGQRRRQGRPPGGAELQAAPARQAAALPPQRHWARGAWPWPALCGPPPRVAACHKP